MWPHHYTKCLAYHTHPVTSALLVVSPMDVILFTTMAVPKKPVMPDRTLPNQVISDIRVVIPDAAPL